MTIIGVRVRVSPSANDVVVLLREEHGEKAVPILIGPHEGVAIASAQTRVSPGRPGPYDLLLAALDATDTTLEKVEIIELRGGVFISELILSNGKRVDSRTSDAIALALRADAEVFCANEIVEEAGLYLDTADDNEEMYLSRNQDAEAELAEFRSFLEEVDPADFESEEE